MSQDDFTFSFQPHKKGLGQILGDLEAPIMTFLWESGPCSVRHVYKHLQEENKIAYTTVMTVMSRLAEKGLLTRDKDGKAFVYTPAVSKEKFTSSTMKRIFSALLGEWGAPVISSLVDYVQEDKPERMEELARLVEEKRR